MAISIANNIFFFVAAQKLEVLSFLFQNDDHHHHDAIIFSKFICYIALRPHFISNWSKYKVFDLKILCESMEMKYESVVFMLNQNCSPNISFLSSEITFYNAVDHTNCPELADFHQFPH